MVSLACPGHCCAVFPLNVERDGLDDLVPTDGLDDIAARQNKIPDGQYIYEMLLPLTPDSAAERWAVHAGQALPLSWHEDTHLFTCSHWDQRTHLCRDYENRPQLCRDYPYAYACEHCGLIADVTTQAVYVRAWDPGGALWDDAAGGYRMASIEGWEGNWEEDWEWDGTILRPRPSDGWTWNHDDHRWIRQAADA